MSSRSARALAAASLLCLLPAGPTPMREAAAQTTATQGRPEPGSQSDVTSFQSPMILEIPLESFDGLLQKKWVPIDDVPRYRCDGVSLQKVRVRATLRKGGEIGLDVKLETFTVPGRDKWADLRFDLVLDGAVINSTLIRDVDAEERTTRGVSAYLEVPAEKTEGLEKPILKITVTVSED